MRKCLSWARALLSTSVGHNEKMLSGAQVGSKALKLILQTGTSSGSVCEQCSFEESIVSSV
jgi:hypothetical protein